MRYRHVPHRIKSGSLCQVCPNSHEREARGDALRARRPTSSYHLPSERRANRHTGAVPDVQPYGDRRPYAVPDRLADLTGPASGHVVLPPELGWTGRTVYDLDDPADAAVLYERVLVDAVRTQEVTRLLNASRLRLMWSRLYLPARVRHIWETRFSDLSAAA